MSPFIASPFVTSPLERQMRNGSMRGAAHSLPGNWNATNSDDAPTTCTLWDTTMTVEDEPQSDCGKASQSEAISPSTRSPSTRSPSMGDPSMGDVTVVLSRIELGEAQAAAQLMPLVYEELRKLAAAKMAQERPDQTLQATALVHEAYVRLVGNEQAQCWSSRHHFFAAAAEAMRRILVEQARRKAGPKAGGDLQRHDIEHVEIQTRRPSVDILALHEALERLALKDPRKAELVKLRFFAGMSNEQAAEVLGITPRTACSDWGYARAWLRVEMADQAVAGD
jgi:RNA polymerase sigma factor (TIGR02999 family)